MPAFLVRFSGDVFSTVTRKVNSIPKHRDYLLRLLQSAIMIHGIWQGGAPSRAFLAVGALAALPVQAEYAQTCRRSKQTSPAGVGGGMA
jgi:hypothetical protein